MKLSLSAFPDGLAGASLLLLRASVMLSLANAEIAAPLSDFQFIFLFYVLAVMIGAGCYTRVAGILSVIGFATLTNTANPAELPALLVHGLDAAALALIGPGAYSLDAQRFGRQTFRLPR